MYGPLPRRKHASNEINSIDTIKYIMEHVRLLKLWAPRKQSASGWRTPSFSLGDGQLTFSSRKSNAWKRSGSFSTTKMEWKIF